MAYRILGGRPRSAASSAPGDMVIHNTTPTTTTPVPTPTPAKLPETIIPQDIAQKTEHPLRSRKKPSAGPMARAGTPQHSTDPAHSNAADNNDDTPPAWWEKTQDGVGVSSSRGWRRRLVDTLWRAGPVWCCWTSLAAFVVLNLAVLVCEGPRYLYGSGLLFMAVAIPFPVLGIRWWRKSGCRA